MNGWWVLGGLVAFYSVAWLCQMFYHLGWQHGAESGFRATVAEKRKQDDLAQMPCDRDYI